MSNLTQIIRFQQMSSFAYRRKRMQNIYRFDSKQWNERMRIYELQFVYTSFIFESIGVEKKVVRIESIHRLKCVSRGVIGTLRFRLIDQAEKTKSEIKEL